MSDDDIVSVQTICAVSAERAEELLEAASGEVSRAIEIHLQQNSRHDAVIEIAEEDEEVVEIVDPKKQKQEESSGIPPKKKQRNDVAYAARKKQSASPGSKQTTLHSFLGIKKSREKAEKAQPSIHSFFSVKAISQSNGQSENAVDESTEAPMDESDGNNAETCPANAKPMGNDIKTEPKPPMEKQASLESPTSSQIKREDDFEAESPRLQKKDPASPPAASPAKQDPTQVDPRLSYATLAKALSEITSTTKRNAKLNRLKTVIIGVIEAVGGIGGNISSRKTDAKTLTFALELISGKISPDDCEIVSPPPLQVSGVAVSSAVQIVTGGVLKSRMQEVYRATGDLGDVAAQFFAPAKSAQSFFVPRGSAEQADQNSACKDSASIALIHELMQSVANVPKGSGSKKARQNILVKLLRLSSSKEEVRFIVRTLLGNMRLGATTKSLLAALAMAVQQIETQKEVSTQDPAIQMVQKTFDICPRLNKLALSLLCGGIERMVQECSLEVGTPIGPMLAGPAHALDEVSKLMLKGLSNTSTSNVIVAEWKYDGVRCQAHYGGDDDNMKLFSRHLIDNTLQYPDAANYLLEARQSENVTSFIIDAEIVGVAKSDGKEDDEWRLLPFQILSTRRGTKNADNNTVKIRVYAFDLMYLNGVSLLKKPLWERQQILRENFRETSGFTFAACREFATFDEQEITAHLQDAVKGGAEGLMIKMTGRVEESCKNGAQSGTVISRQFPCPYESGTRSPTWLKLKRDYLSNFSDTLDVVPIGAWYGNGRKAEKGFLSPILFAVYDEDDGVFRSISRCMSFTDAMYAAIKAFYFHGTPYPDDVGQTVDAAAKASSNQEGEAKSDGSGSEVDDEEGRDGEDMGTGVGDDSDSDENQNQFVGVNCFSARPPTSVYATNESPTIWFQPKEVWEVSFADLTLSRTHMAAAGRVDDSDRGVALRFPRFKRRRPDKGVEQATTSVQIAQLYTKQFKQG